MEETLPPGFRFHPTDEELITYYLTPKISDLGFVSKAVADVDLNKCEPWDLPEKASMGEKEWYFFSLRDRKYPTGLRTNRATEAGYWKTTGKDKEILRSGVVVGMKKTLVFYKGRAPKGEKTNWVMHEYRIHTNHSFRATKEEWVVCRVFRKTAKIKKPQQASSPQESLDSPDDTNTNNTNEFGDLELPNLNSSSPSSTFIAHPPLHLQGYHHDLNTNITYNNINNNDNAFNHIMSPNLNPNISWLGGGGGGGAATASPSSSSWPPSLQSPSLSTTVNSLLLKALQIKSYQMREASNIDIYSLLPQVGSFPFGTTGDLTNASTTTTTIPISSSDTIVNNNSIMNLACTSSQQQQHHVQQEEQPFNMDSLWRNC